MSKQNLKEEALHYHAKGRPGKIEVIPTKEYATQKDLSLAYSPGVADPCMAIFENPEDVYKYTAKGNLVAVISNGTAVLGLGDIGPAASKPVMEGKGLLFKIYADIDVFALIFTWVWTFFGRKAQLRRKCPNWPCAYPSQNDWCGG